jgi:hypothetical protein
MFQLAEVLRKDSKESSNIAARTKLQAQLSLHTSRSCRTRTWCTRRELLRGDRRLRATNLGGCLDDACPSSCWFAEDATRVQSDKIEPLRPLRQAGDLHTESQFAQRDHESLVSYGGCAESEAVLGTWENQSEPKYKQVDVFSAPNLNNFVIPLSGTTFTQKTHN